LQKKETLIVYGTRYHATEETVAEISSVLEKEYNHNVEIFNLKEYRSCPDLSMYDNIILGTGIEYGAWTENAEKFLGREELKDKKIAVFVSSHYAGEPDKHDEALQKYVVEVISKYEQIKPVSMEAFGGRVPKEKIPDLFDRRVLARLHENQVDNRDWEKIKDWAKILGKLLE